MNTFRLLPLIAAALLIAACGDKEEESAGKPPDSAEKLYSDARAELDDKSYKNAVEAFAEVERQHPYSEWANNAQIMAAYANYKAEKYDEAIGMLERYVKLYPDNDSTPYAYYLIALCYYDQISDVGRDQKMTEKALQALRDVIRRFPNSEYARDAKIKEDLTIDHLAGKEMQVGRWYLKQDDYIAAVNRFRFVVENYQTTSHVPEALHRLVECYLKLGVPEEAKRYAAVLGYNYPGSSWYRDSYRMMTGEDVKPGQAPQKVSEPASPDMALPGENKKGSWWERLIP